MKNLSRRSGFTLVEIMVVVVIMAILAAIVVPRILTRPEQARLVKAKQDIQTIENAMDLYKLDNGFYPSTEQGIAALVTKPTSDPVPANWAGYLKQAPMDPWGKPYQYLNPGQHGEIDIFSFGPSSGKAANNAEIGNWNIEQPAAKSQ